MSNILVLGDSFASSEEGNPHFLELWGNKHNHNVNCIGMPGASPVAIASEFIKKDLRNVDVAFYFIANFLGASLSFEGSESISDESKLMPKTYDQHFLYNFTRLLEYVSTSKSTLHDPNKHVRLNLLEHDKLTPLQQELIKGFYTGVEPEWLFRANYFAMCNIFTRLKKHNAKVVIVFPRSGLYEKKISKIMVDVEEDIEQLIKMKNISPGVEKKYVSHLSNHLGPEDAKETAELFEEYLQKTPNIKALLNK